jgi:hypothetical protein
MSAARGPMVRREITNLERFLLASTPAPPLFRVPAQGGKGTPQLAYSMATMWRFFARPWGVSVPLHFDRDNGQQKVMVHYQPFLSALEFFPARGRDAEPTRCVPSCTRPLRARAHRPRSFFETAPPGRRKMLVDMVSVCKRLAALRLTEAPQVRKLSETDAGVASGLSTEFDMQRSWFSVIWCVHVSHCAVHTHTRH